MISTSTSYILETQCPSMNLPNSGRMNLHPDLGKNFFFADILGSWWGIASVKLQESASRLGQYRGCTLGCRKKNADIRVQKYACGHGKQPYYYILPWFLPQWIRDPWFSDLGKIADLLAWGTPYPSQPQIRRITKCYFIFYPSTNPQKNYLNYDQMVIACSDWHFHE